MKRVKGLTEITTHMGIFDYEVVVVMGDYKRLTRYIQWKFEDSSYPYEAGETHRGMCLYREGYVPVVWIPRKPKTPREHATLAHECLHAVYHLMEWAKVPMSRDTEEVVCHAVAHLVNAALS